ncbi:MAG: phosphatase PAP2 family protein [Clostridiales bacterium]|nr:phosphatase PAP2 family protein [Clostridiales bacterium]
MLTTIQNIDFYILDFLQLTARSPFWDKFLSFFTILGDPFMFVCYCAMLLVVKKTRKDGIMVTCGLLSGLLITNVILKNLVRRPRPCWLHPEVQLLIANPKDYSFPSGHTMAATVFTIILVHNHPKLAYGLIPAALLIIYSRLYLYVHFPSDVLAALILGVGVGLLTCYLEPKVSKKLADRHPSEAKQ